MKRKDITGQIFGSLQALEIDQERYTKNKEQSDKRIRIYWKCRCLKCGRIVSVRGENLRSGNSKGCGCDKFEKSALSSKKYNRYEYDKSKNCMIVFASNTNNPFLIDLDDYDKISKFCWYETNHKYLMTRISETRKQILLHRFIIFGDTISDKQVDHINRNTYDCRKSNLRECLPIENSRNKGISTLNTSGFTGVSFSKQYNKWRAFVTINKKYISLGYYNTKEEAIKARLNGELEYYGEFSPNAKNPKKR